MRWCLSYTLCSVCVCVCVGGEGLFAHYAEKTCNNVMVWPCPRKAGCKNRLEMLLLKRFKRESMQVCILVREVFYNELRYTW